MNAQIPAMQPLHPERANPTPAVGQTWRRKRAIGFTTAHPSFCVTHLSGSIVRGRSTWEVKMSIRITTLLAEWELVR